MTAESSPRDKTVEIYAFEHVNVLCISLAVAHRRWQDALSLWQEMKSETCIASLNSLWL